MTIWMVFLCLMTYVFIRDGGFHQFDLQLEIAILAGFWFFGFAAFAYFFSLPVTRLQLLNDKIILVETWILKKETHALEKSEIKDIYVKTILNSDGDNYELILQTHQKNFVIQQSSDLKEIEDLKKRLEKLF